MFSRGVIHKKTWFHTLYQPCTQSTTFYQEYTNKTIQVDPLFPPPTPRLREYLNVDYYLKPLVSTLPLYICDTTDFLKQNRQATHSTVWLPPCHSRCNIIVHEHEDGIEACKDALNQHTNLTFPTADLCHLMIELILQRMCFLSIEKSNYKNMAQQWAQGWPPLIQTCLWGSLNKDYL